jgi:hypothetical protein
VLNELVNVKNGIDSRFSLCYLSFCVMKTKQTNYLQIIFIIRHRSLPENYVLKMTTSCQFIYMSPLVISHPKKLSLLAFLHLKGLGDVMALGKNVINRVNREKLNLQSWKMELTVCIPYSVIFLCDEN